MNQTERDGSSLEGDKTWVPNKNFLGGKSKM